MGPESKGCLQEEQLLCNCKRYIVGLSVAKQILIERMAAAPGDPKKNFRKKPQVGRKRRCCRPKRAGKTRPGDGSDHLSAKECTRWLAKPGKSRASSPQVSFQRSHPQNGDTEFLLSHPVCGAVL